MVKTKPYKISIGRIRLWLLKLKAANQHTKKTRMEASYKFRMKINDKQDLKDGWEDFEEVLYYKNFLNVLEIIRTKSISYHHNNLLENYFGIKKPQKLVAKKYYLPTLKINIKFYIKDCNINLALKVVKYKPYND